MFLTLLAAVVTLLLLVYLLTARSAPGMVLGRYGRFRNAALLRRTIRCSISIPAAKGPMVMLWILPALVLVIATVLAIPLGYYQAWIFSAEFQPPRWLAWFERRVDTGPQKWKHYLLALLTFNVVAFLIGFAVLALQPFHPHFLNPDGKGMLAPSTIFNTMCSFLSNTNLQHYSGEVHLSYGSQLFGIAWSQFISPVIGLAALIAMIRGLRGDAHMGNFYLDMWRGVVYLFVPVAFVVAVLLMACGMPMTMDGQAHATTVEAGAMGNTDAGAAKPQDIARGPVAAIVAIKQIGTNGGGFFGANSAHPFENPNSWSSLIECVCIIMLPIACLVMFGRMLRNMPHARVIYGVMFVLSVATIAWAIHWDTAKPNPGLTGVKESKDYEIAAPDADGGKIKVSVPVLAGLPVDQSLGNLEGKELRFGTSAGATWAALDHQHFQWLGQLHPRQPQSAGVPHAADRHVAQLHLGRRRRRLDQSVGLPDRRRLSRRLDGRPNARVSRQESRSPGDEAGLAGTVDPSADDSGAGRVVRRDRLGAEDGRQSRSPRFLRTGV